MYYWRNGEEPEESSEDQLQYQRIADAGSVITGGGKAIHCLTVIGQIEEEMKKRGAVNAIMSGSGPTVFGLFINPMAAKAAYDALRFGEASGLAKQVYLTNFYNNV